jgi:hypothetical protein
MLIIAFYLALLLCSAVAARVFLHDPYRDIKAPKPYAVEIPDMTFDSRGFA